MTFGQLRIDSMKKIALIGATGMLGSGVYHALKDKHELVLVVRDVSKIELLEQTYGSTAKHRVVEFDITKAMQGNAKKNLEDLVLAIDQVDLVVNCSGIIKPYSEDNLFDTYTINGWFPMQMSWYYNKRFIHITTDCEFNGTDGLAPYKESYRQDPEDHYGLSKYLGNCSYGSKVFRTSVIGPELEGKLGLLEWVKQQEGKTITGYTNHLWNGITTVQFGKIIDHVAETNDEWPRNGLFNIFSTDISKYNLVKKIAERYEVKVTIEPGDADIAVDRRLMTMYPEVIEHLAIPDLKTMLNELP